MSISERIRSPRAREEGFTLIELVVTVAIMGLIVTGLTGVIIQYMRTTVSTSARLTESHDVQFASVYWQRDVASIGVRMPAFDDTSHTFLLQQSVSAGGSLATCALPSGTKVITLAWSTYSLDATATPSQTTTTVTYVAALSGTTYQLSRVLCSGSSRTSTIVVAANLTGPPSATCSGGGVTGCGDTSGAVPTKITLQLTSTDPNNADGTTYQQTLLGERRQT